ncbi:thioesterase II family protein [Parendozoicomonas haliclonae]|uniref:Linear gramicidin dehydrogenase LgrE n=1 Tax=Parendozoicomonas haliclonae TaxID=1960125 RepID=A0A1X7AFQ1_9GAMM|nr:thioesterase domain-containing protein [Parendozoicomonas haliclonae]SMA38212.1 Linear gramicidin dehydrogenase LgrE [Parendozoicomonas haliclonae]
MIIFFLPYAGGSETIYRDWDSGKEDMVFVPLSLPGRGSRFHEPLLTTIEDMVADLVHQMSQRLQEGESYSLFGHSMGAMLSYEIVRSAPSFQFPVPVHIFLSGCEPPHYQRKLFLSDKDDDQIIALLTRLGSIPKVLQSETALLQMLLPILKTDYAMVESWSGHYANTVSVPITTLAGDCDDVAIQDFIRKWSLYTTLNHSHYQYQGNHFFLEMNRGEIIKMIVDTLLSHS